MGSLTASGQTITFGAPGQDGTVAWTQDAVAVVGNPLNGYNLVVLAGTLRATDGGLGFLLSVATHTTIQSPATLDLAGIGAAVNDLHGDGNIGNSGGAATLTINGGSFSGVIGGPLSLIVNPGQLTLSGANAYTGSTTINSGATLILGADSTAGSVPGAITDNGVLAINRSDSFVVNNVSGTGVLRQIGDGVTTLGNGLSYSGDTQISGGTLVINDPTALGAGGIVTSGGGLRAGATETINNALTMNGDFTIAAAGGQTLTITSWFLNRNGQTIAFGTPGQNGTVVWDSSGGAAIFNPPANGYTVLVQAGTMRVNDFFSGQFLTLGTHTAIRPAGTLDANGHSFTVNDLHGGGHVIDSAAAATLTVNGGSFGGVISGPLSLIVNGAAPLSLAGNNTYIGGTTINSGATLILGAGGTAGSVPGIITDNGALAINRSDSFVVNNVTGTGQLQQTGPGTTTLGTGLSYTGGTLISAGTLIVNDPAALGSGALTIQAANCWQGRPRQSPTHWR